jgi:hypothetical protein
VELKTIVGIFHNGNFQMKPIIIIPPNFMSQSDIEQLDKNGICVVIAKDPKRVKFVDPIPAIASRTEIESAALELSKRLLSIRWWQESNQGHSVTREEISRFYVKILLGKWTDAQPKDAQPVDQITR